MCPEIINLWTKDKFPSSVSRLFTASHTAVYNTIQSSTFFFQMKKMWRRKWNYYYTAWRKPFAHWAEIEWKWPKSLAWTWQIVAMESWSKSSQIIYDEISGHSTCFFIYFHGSCCTLLFIVLYSLIPVIYLPMQVPGLQTGRHTSTCPPV